MPLEQFVYAYSIAVANCVFQRLGRAATERLDGLQSDLQGSNIQYRRLGGAGMHKQLLPFQLYERATLGHALSSGIHKCKYLEGFLVRYRRRPRLHELQNLVDQRRIVE